MIHKFLFLILCLWLYSCSANKYQKQNRTTSEIVRVLSSDSLEGRRPGTPGFEKAAKYVEGYLSMLEIKPFFNGSYHDSLLVSAKPSFNIVGVIESKRHSDDYILLGAHLDHLGMRGSLPDSIFNGANDNASGVTAVLQIAKHLKQHKLNKNVIIALFTGEESGLIGSYHLAKKLKNDNIDLDYMINIEMIGRPLTNYPDNVYITGYDKSNFAELANDIEGDEFIIHKGVEFSDQLFGSSDNYPFYVEYKIPSHTISTFDFRNDRNFHSPEDEYSHLNIQHMNSIINKTNVILLGLLHKKRKN